jgi:hypothetical protein
MKRFHDIELCLSPVNTSTLVGRPARFDNDQCSCRTFAGNAVGQKRGGFASETAACCIARNAEAAVT